jgi:hypothetical protein
MTAPTDLSDATTLADRLVRELMLVSVLVAGEGAGAIAAALEDAGAAAELLQPGQAQEGFDLAILLTPAGAAADPATRAVVDALARGSDRLLLAPLPLGLPAEPGGPALPELPQWFELFAEHGYQPVVEFDAGFISAGAFLVDRGATADEADLAAFTDRLQLGAEAASAQRAVVQEAERNVRAELAAVRAELAKRQSELDEMTARASAWAEVAAQAQSALANTQSALAEAEARNAGWDALRAWVQLEVADPARNSVARLARDLPRINELRAPDLPPLAMPETRRPGWLARLFGARASEPAVPREVAITRADPALDFAGTIASTPALAAGVAVDPALYVALVAAPRAPKP